MTSEELEKSTQVIWTTFVVLFELDSLWPLPQKNRKSNRSEFLCKNLWITNPVFHLPSFFLFHFMFICTVCLEWLLFYEIAVISASVTFMKLFFAVKWHECNDQSWTVLQMCVNSFYDVNLSVPPLEQV